MYLEEVILDGFKSYANRTVIGPFHPQFNAISGLNGTGKSNILDAVCFVMGIKSLNQMRVSKVDELIYKQGQAGVTKASVTLIFRNDDRQGSPIGMADLPKITITRQIAIGGRERFVMNGHNARMSDIQTVFQSVQLNVNHPHFLVMQGRITKVINMKPPEILGMIEESAGTRLYEMKRSESAKKIATKETKLQEINSVVENEIEPSLERLRKEQEEYATSMRIAENISRLEKFCLGYESFRITDEIAKLQKTQGSNEEEARLLGQKLITEKNRVNILDEQLATDGQETGAAFRSQLLELAQKKRNLENKLAVAKIAVNEAKEDKRKVEAEIEESNGTIISIEKQLDKVIRLSEKDMKKEKECRQKLEVLQEKMENLKASLEEMRTGHIAAQDGSHPSSEAGCRQTIREKLMEAELAVKNGDAEVQQLKMAITKWDQDIRDIENNRSVEHQAKNLQNLVFQIKSYEENKIDLQNRLKETENVVSKRIGLEKRRAELEAECNAISETLQTLSRKVFQITRVHQENPNGTQEGIEGVAAELFRVNKENGMYTLALEEAGKGRLLNIVVQDDEVAKRLLEKYKSIRRITCIPLNRIRSKPISDERLALAKKVACLPNDSSDVMRPLDAAEPKASRFIPALTFVFGQAFLCASPAVAQAISQHPDVKGLAITVDGDHYNPAGSVSGGSQSGLGNLLRNLEELHEAKHQEEDLKEQYRSVDDELRRVRETSALADQTVRQLEALEIALRAAKVRLEELQRNSAAGRLAEVHEKRREALDKLETLQSGTLPHLRNVVIPDLQQELQGSAESRTDRIEQLETQLNKLKPQLSSAEEELNQCNQANHTIHQEIAVLQEQLSTLKSQREHKLTVGTPHCEKEIENAERVHDELASSLKTVTNNIDDVNTQLKKTTQHSTEVAQTKSILECSIADAEAKLAKIQHSLRGDKKILLDLEKRRGMLLEEHPWIRAEQHLFNKPGGQFDFSKPDASACFEELDTLRRTNQKIQRKVSKNVVTVLEACQKELHELKEKKAQLIRDKKKLEEFIDELDIKKRIALEACWKQVDEYFSAIFSTLLASSDAHLCLTGSQKLEDGLEMQVTLSGVQKSSLGELSGGQRSLLALSLILALLKYKPAPLYILDEIDAALDLSHTQRIGEMIRTQFSSSQFLIVSLKENLFNYADVLFRTSFLNGTSCITRSTNSVSAGDGNTKKRVSQRAGTKRR